MVCEFTWAPLRARYALDVPVGRAGTLGSWASGTFHPIGVGAVTRWAATASTATTEPGDTIDGLVLEEIHHSTSRAVEPVQRSTGDVAVTEPRWTVRHGPASDSPLHVP